MAQTRPLWVSIDFEDAAHDLKRDLGLWETGPLRGDALWRSYEIINSFYTTHRTNGTFFCTGIIATQMPDLIKQIAQDGHEVACHYYFHDEANKQSADQFEYFCRRAKDELESASNSSVIGFRAPKFLVEKNNPSQYKVIEKIFSYDSSVHVASKADLAEFKSRMNLETLRLLPIFKGKPYPGTPTMRLGGSYLKLFPLSFARNLADAAHQSGLGAHVYVHPYEMVTDKSFSLSSQELSPLGFKQSSYLQLRQRQWHSFGNTTVKRKLDTLSQEFMLQGRLDHFLTQHVVLS